ncbi:hypothetical protein BC936DRAFT_148429 [Jimgerdemannia flammicorona]|uniref:Uncharacterized protein n=1 Tax=Jimgerdemannia flammicorona TaxID=994334 RepID=A0A433D340_9FUNG|nr:hypothetical protein BC936DRAFT_148429 [Jimgerdemannia flammicorona]
MAILINLVHISDIVRIRHTDTDDDAATRGFRTFATRMKTYHGLVRGRVLLDGYDSDERDAAGAQWNFGSLSMHIYGFGL